MSSFVETQSNWRHASEGQQFDNLFSHGLDRRSVAAYSVTVGKTYSPRNKMRGTAMMPFGRLVSNVRSTVRDKTTY